MPYSVYKDADTGNYVDATECGHGGTLMSSHQNFVEGDFIVLFPVDLEGKRSQRVFPADDFRKRFGGEGKKIDWKAMGWLS